MMEHSKENLNRIRNFYECDYLQNLIYAVNNCRNSNIEWSLDGKYLKINYYRFYKEYLCTVPIRCKSVLDFVSIMEFCGFRCVHGPYEGKTDELIFVRLENCDQKFCYPLEKFGTYENEYQDGSYVKNYCKTYPYMRENLQLEHVENHSVCYNESLTYRATKSSQYHQETERMISRKRKRQVPEHCYDYLTDIPGKKPHYLAKPLPCYKICKGWEESNYFEQYGNQYSVITKTNTAFGDDRGSKYWHEKQTVTFIERNGYFRSHLDNYIVERPEKKRSNFKYTPSPRSKDFKKEEKETGDFDQFENQYNCSGKNSTKSPDNKNFEYIINPKIKTSKETHNYFTNEFEDCLLESPRKTRDYLRETPKFCSKVLEKKRQTEVDLMESESAINVQCNDITESVNKESYNYSNKNQTNDLTDIDRCFPDYFYDYLIEIPGEETSPYSNNSKKKWKENLDYELFENKCSTSRNNIANSGDSKCLKFNKETKTKPLKNRKTCFPSVYEKEIPVMKETCLRKTSSPSSDDSMKKLNGKTNFDQSGKQNSFSCNSVTKCDNNKDFKCNNKPKTKPLRERNSIFPSHFNDFVIDIPIKKRSYLNNKPSPISESYKKKRKKRSSSQSVRNSFDFSKCAFFKNPNFMSKLIYYNDDDDDCDHVFLRKTSKDIMLCRDCNSNERSVLIEDQKNYDDIIYNYEDDSDDIFLKETSKDIFLSCDFDSNECSVIVETQKTAAADDDAIIYIHEDDSDDIFLKETSKDIMLSYDYESDNSSEITEKQKTDDDIIYICDCPATVTT